MKQYFYIDANGNQVGPCTTEQLRSAQLTPNTLIWCEGMSNWEKASTIAELKATNPFTPPVPPTAHTSNHSTQPQTRDNNDIKPETYMVWAIIATLLCCLPIGIVAIVHANKVDTLWTQGDKAGAKKASDNAKMWCFISAGAGLLVSLLYILIIILSSL